ncbi:RLMF [Blepharisma stoltei]|uniref:U6 small nuclear RNA (adenine-(43)-N(6))-methyltransferase n=1 Tax=Blepharisma stoltei TaxID=1481888 RepID=A0AAU9JHI5_9CILI|nr:unnamed protein product [Blepharisma stoltei]
MERTNFNQRMHPLNKYLNHRPDYLALSKKYHWFAKHVKGRALDYSSDEACNALVKVLLLEDFNIKYWKIPDGYLVPTVPQRLNYLCWIKEILQKNDPVILDIGTGASLIYPLLGVAEFNWNFVATDIDEIAIQNARKIIEKNELEGKIMLIKVEKTQIIREITQNFDVSICNPPFYSSDYNAESLNGYGGRSNEMKTPGGECKFIGDYIDESWGKRQEVEWFTTLVGVKSHLKIMMDYLNTQFSNVLIKTTTFYQGKTLRWGLAWKFIEKTITIEEDNSSQSDN